MILIESLEGFHDDWQMVIELTLEDQGSKPAIVMGEMQQEWNKQNII